MVSLRAILHSGGDRWPGRFRETPYWRGMEVSADGRRSDAGSDGRASCKKAIENRKKAIEQKRLLQDVEQINEARRIKASWKRPRRARSLRSASAGVLLDSPPATARIRSAAIAELDEAAEATPRAAPKSKSRWKTSTEPEAVGKKMLNVIVKADFSGTVEAVVGAIASIGNAEAGVKIVRHCRRASEGDVAKAAALDATIIGFNVNPSKSVLQAASRTKPTRYALLPPT